jgi:hypothetical protein
VRIVSYSENRRAVEITAKVLNDPPSPGMVYMLPVPGPPLASLYTTEEGKAELFRTYLRGLFDEWLRCGKKVMPTESNAWASGIGPVPPYSTETTWTVFLVPEGLGTRPRESLKPVDESDPAFDSWLWKVYWDYLWHRKPTIWFDSRGEVFFQYMSPANENPIKPVTIPPFLNAESARSTAWAEAVLWFILVLNSGHAQLLDRCVHCQRYFVRQREMKEGQLYKRNGPSCGTCKGLDSNARTQTARDKAKDRMLDVAAEEWGNWKHSHRTPDRYKAVMHRVNERCRNEIHVTTRKHRIEARWVKRNEREITLRAEQRIEPKGANQNAKS